MTDKKTVNVPGAAVAQQQLIESASSSYHLKGTSDRGQPSNGWDVLEAMPAWKERYVDLYESLQELPDAKYSLSQAHSGLVNTFNTYAKLAKDADKLANATSRQRNTLNALNDRLNFRGLTESLNRKSGTQVNLVESQFGPGTSISTTSINNPAYSVVDMVGIFFPGTVLNHMTDVMPLPQKFNQVYRLLPQYGQDGGGVTANQVIFQNITNGTYASVYRSDTFVPAAFVANVAQTFSLADQSLTPNVPEIAQPKSIYVTVVYTSPAQPNITEIYRDDGNGLLIPISSGFPAASLTPLTSNLDITNSSVQYQVANAVSPDGLNTDVGVALVNPTVLVGANTYTPTTVQINFLYDYQEDNFENTQIRTVEMSIKTVQMEAYAHPLKMAVSAEMEFEVKSIAEVSIMDSAQQTCVGLIAMERDINYINTIGSVATNSAALSFNAQSSIYYPVTALYTTFINTLIQVDNLIKSGMGRGQLDCLIVGPQVRTMLASCPFFQPAKSVSSIGFQMIGTIFDGTVSVVYNPFLNPAALSETFLAYFKGYAASDAPVMHGDWLPFYITSEMPMYDLNTYQSVCSWYVQQINPYVTESTVNPNGSYVYAGTVVNFGL